jgi:hypothetical protein
MLHVEVSPSGGFTVFRISLETLRIESVFLSEMFVTDERTDKLRISISDSITIVNANGLLNSYLAQQAVHSPSKGIHSASGPSDFKAQPFQSDVDPWFSSTRFGIS